jgi:hypothetical protein
VDASDFYGQGPRLQDLRLRKLILPRCCAHGLVSAYVDREHASDDSRRDECEQQSRCDQPLLVSAPPRFSAP